MQLSCFFKTFMFPYGGNEVLESNQRNSAIAFLWLLSRKHFPQLWDDGLAPHGDHCYYYRLAFLCLPLTLVWTLVVSAKCNKAFDACRHKINWSERSSGNLLRIRQRQSSKASYRRTSRRTTTCRFTYPFLLLFVVDFLFFRFIFRSS